MPEVLYWRYQFICWVWCRNFLIHLYHVLTTVPSTVWELKTLEKKNHKTIMMLKTYFINVIEYSINIQIFQVIT